MRINISMKKTKRRKINRKFNLMMTKKSLKSYCYRISFAKRSKNLAKHSNLSVKSSKVSF